MSYVIEQSLVIIADSRPDLKTRPLSANHGETGRGLYGG